MSGYTKVATSAEVWAVIMAKHRELVVFSSFSDPDGTFNGGPGDRGRVMTSFGFSGVDYPIIEAVTTWDIDQSQPNKRFNEVHRYWLCIACKQE